MFGGYGFSQSSSSTFGFGQPASSSSSLFGAAPASTGGGLFGGAFGAQPQSSSSLFGTPAPQGFGAAAAPQGFGAVPTQGFGAAPSQGFGAARSPTGAFGATSPFGGQPPQPMGGFGAPTGGFGAPSPFGAPASSAAPSPFGATPSPFGASTPSPFAGGAGGGAFGGPSPFGGTPHQLGGAQGTGVHAYKMTPDTEMGGMKIVALTAMDVYKNKSLEELRLEDYRLGKGPAGTTPFGGAAASPFGGPGGPSPFGAAASTPSPFGAPTTPSPFGAPVSSAASPFGMQSATPSPFGGAAAGGLFGQQPQAAATTGLFGQPPAAQQPGGIFGQPASTGGGIFGMPTSSSSTPFGAPLGGLFGTQPQSSAAGFGFGGGAPTPAAGGFSFGQAPASSSTSMFGQAPTGGLFGAPASTGGGIFGAAPLAGGLFGAQPQSSAGGGLFGAPTSGGGLFGQPPAGGGGLFGQPASSSGGLFGGALAGGGLFGAPQSSGGGLFGATPAGGGLFGTPASSGGGLFGAAPVSSSSSSLFGAPPTGGLFGAASTGGGLIGGPTQVSGGLFGGAQAAPAPAPAAPAAPAYAPLPVPPKPAGLILPKPLDRGAAAFLWKPDPASLMTAPSLVAPVPAPSVLPGWMSPSAALPSGGRSPSARLRTYSPTGGSVFQSPRRSGQSVADSIARPAVVPALPALPALPTPKYADRLVTERRWGGGRPVVSLSPEAAPVGGVSTSRGRVQDMIPILNAASMYTVPSIEALSSMTEAELARVDHFAIGHYALGRVTWPGLTDVRYLRVDEVVEFEEGAVVVYREESSKPPLGQGLNKPAVVELKLKAAISGDGGGVLARYVTKLKAATEAMGAVFIAYDGETWRFRVEHFSRWGLGSMDEWQEVLAEASSEAPAVPEAASLLGEVAEVPEAEEEVAMLPQDSTTDEEVDDRLPPLPIKLRSAKELEILGWNLSKKPETSAWMEQSWRPVFRGDHELVIVAGSEVEILGVSDSSTTTTTTQVSEALKMLKGELAMPEYLSEAVALLETQAAGDQKELLSWLVSAAREEVGAKYPEAAEAWVLVNAQEKAAEVLARQGEGQKAMAVAAGALDVVVGAKEVEGAKNKYGWKVSVVGRLIFGAAVAEEVAEDPVEAVWWFLWRGDSAVEVKNDLVMSWFLSSLAKAPGAKRLAVEVANAAKEFGEEALRATDVDEELVQRWCLVNK